MKRTFIIVTSTAILLAFNSCLAKIQAQNYQITFAGTGSSTTIDSVKVENTTQCTVTALGGGDILNLNSVTGINELNNNADNMLHVFPNPTTGTSIISFNATASGNTITELYDMAGKRIIRSQDYLSKGNQSYSLKGIGSGIYIIHIKSDEYSYTSKIVSNDEAISNPELNHISAIQGIDKQTTVSKTEKISNVKSGSTIQMQFNAGDTLKLTGKSGNFRTVMMLFPANSQTVIFTFVNCTDADSNHYAVVQIGTQLWMEENLKTTKYRNGNAISNVADGTAWSALTTGAYCNYNNTTNTDTINTYGRLYNWYSIGDSRNIAPTGWHVASDSEWTVLTTYLLGESVAGGKLKETCLTHWYSPNTGATNETGFSALPGGYRLSNGAFDYIGDSGHWWSSTEYSTTDAWYRGMYYYLSNVLRINGNYKGYGFSVRCVRDK